MARMAQVLAGVALALGGWVAGTATGCGTARAGAGIEHSVECTDNQATLKTSGDKEELAAGWRAYGVEKYSPSRVVQINLAAADGQVIARCDGSPAVARVVFVEP